MQLQTIVNQGHRVLTTSQLAEAYGTDSDRINRNFNRNKERYQENKHYFQLEGEQLKEFRANGQIDLPPNVNRLYLWTEKGAWLHAKSLNTDGAWDAYEMLVDDYYTIKENVVPLSKDQALITALKTTANLLERQQEVEQEQHEIRKLVTQIDNKVEEQITLTSGEQRRLQKGIASKIYEICDDPKARPTLFRELHREIKDRFGVASYKDVKRKELQSAIRYVENWIPKRVS
ncbi:ORF6N domain-containing protein [Heyndrickxia sporothermodurans]|uniref:ORF6N domain-containing protein n=1 Tax=Heyndrickxia sporothermodurans TaxID=46224 RepID=UPI002DBE1B76|nr:ORF6N domain-containing protein [Heyndrickxia sporothermodurans]MEB6549123.1 ORF6N domain-containing protein [Heyndrickxia sporothermodurans]